MPIDIRRLAKDPEQNSAYRQSLTKRGESEETLDHVLKLQEECAGIWKERNRIKSLNDGDRKKVKELTARHGELQAQLQESLEALPNFVLQEDWRDSKTEGEDNFDGEETTSTQKESLLFALGGYEEFGNRSVVLTDVGASIVRAVDLYADSHWKKQLIEQLASSFRQWKLPGVVEMDSKFVYSMMGRRNVQIEKTKLSAPSWISLLQQQHSGSKYFDRQLPIIHLLSCSSSSESPSLIEDDREVIRRRTWCRKRRRPWHQQLCTDELDRWEILVLTGPLWEADARPIQEKTIQTIIDFFQKLGDGKVSARVLDAEELLPAEAARVVVEGYCDGETVCLGYLSAFLDYNANGINLRHGGTQQGLCVLHGALCSVPETVDWMLQQQWQQEDTKGVFLPECLLRKNTSLSSRSLPLIRRVVTSRKGGKKIVMPINKAKSTGKSDKVTADEIRFEAASCPFDFLPFYNR